jgi:hypothetical protein
MCDAAINQISPFVCDMNAIAPADRDRHISTTLGLFHAVQDICELSNGYGFRLPNETGLLMKAAEFIANERLCCPFFGFRVEVEPGGGPLWLYLTGQDGVKPFIRAEISEAVNKVVAQAAGFH